LEDKKVTLSLNFMIKVPDVNFAVEDLSKVRLTEDSVLSIKANVEKSFIMLAKNMQLDKGILNISKLEFAMSDRFFNVIDMYSQKANKEVDRLAKLMLIDCFDRRKNTPRDVPVVIMDSELNNVFYKNNESKSAGFAYMILPIYIRTLEKNKELVSFFINELNRQNLLFIRTTEAILASEDVIWAFTKNRVLESGGRIIVSISDTACLNEAMGVFKSTNNTPSTEKSVEN
jgi:hypothetical protein